MLGEDADVFFLDLAETIIYRPASRPPRAIPAIVDRAEPTPQSPIGLPAARAIVAVKNHAVEGIDLAALDLAGDAIDLPLRDGGATTTRAITAVLSQDAGVLLLEVQ